MSSIGDGFQIEASARAAIEARSKLTWVAFVETVFDLDLQLIDQGVLPAQRPMRIAERITTQAGHQVIYAAHRRDPISDGVHALLRAVYGRRALGMGPIHVGVIMLRDAFVPFYVPDGYGTFRVQPWDFVEGGGTNLKALTALSPADVSSATDQILDVWDFGWAVNDRRTSRAAGDTLLVQARDQIESACMTLQGSFSQRIALQGTAYAAELAMKALLTKADYGEKRLLSLGHKLVECARAVASEYQSIDSDLLVYAAGKIPPVVSERYANNPKHYSRRDIGEIVGYGQYVLGELARAFSDRNIRSESGDLPGRTFPSLP